jgi:uncharacterized repeat protein (TIGR03833 family)
MDGSERKNVKPGLTVDIVLKQDQRTGRLTRGVVKDILTKSPHHPHGIKVRLETGEVGRVKEVINGGHHNRAEVLTTGPSREGRAHRHRERK